MYTVTAPVNLDLGITATLWLHTFILLYYSIVLASTLCSSSSSQSSTAKTTTLTKTKMIKEMCMKYKHVCLHIVVYRLQLAHTGNQLPSGLLAMDDRDVVQICGRHLDQDHSILCLTTAVYLMLYKAFTLPPKKTIKKRN